jgi:hypothetical protein
MNILHCKLPDTERVYSSRELGEKLAKEFMFDIVDLTKFKIEINVPETTFAITDSFFIGLLEKLYFKIDDKELFCEKIGWVLPLNFKKDRINQLVDRLEYQLMLHKRNLEWCDLENVDNKIKEPFRLLNLTWFYYRIVKETCDNKIFYYPEQKFILIPIWCRFEIAEECIKFNTFNLASDYINKKRATIKKVKPKIEREIYKVDL